MVESEDCGENCGGDCGEDSGSADSDSAEEELVDKVVLDEEEVSKNSQETDAPEEAGRGGSGTVLHISM